MGPLLIAFQTQTHSFHSTVKQLLLYIEHSNTGLPFWAQSDPAHPTSSHVEQHDVILTHHTRADLEIRKTLVGCSNMYCL